MSGARSNAQPSTFNSQLLLLTARRAVPNYTPSLFQPKLSPNMGKQYNKIEKKRRRLNYLARRKAKTAAAGKGGAKVRAKKPAKKKAPAAAAA